MTPITWLVEPEAFGVGYSAFTNAIEVAGHRIIHWRDDWWFDGRVPRLGDSPAVFHGSLGNADRIARELPWQPGAFCRTEAFLCSAWYPMARAWLAHDRWVHTTAAAFVAAPDVVATELAAEGRVFVRPDSPLKPFSGRVCQLEGISLGALDHGFYYDDPNLPVVVAPVRAIGEEWRFVVANGRVVAGSGYEASRRAQVQPGAERAAARAQEIADVLEAPEAVYVLDLADCDGELRLLELNPFSGADLYGCDPDAVVAAVSGVAESYAPLRT